MWSGINRRRFPRANYPCRITVKRKDLPDTLSATTENIGVGGICTMLPKDLGIFAPVEIQLDLTDGRPVIACDATVVWIVKEKEKDKLTYDTGIEFTNLKRDDANRIDETVEKILKEEK